MKYLTELVKTVGKKALHIQTSFPVPTSIQNMYLAFSRTRVRISAFLPSETQDMFFQRRLDLMISVDSKDPDLVHIGELGDHQHDHSKSVEEEHGVLVVSGVRRYQIPVRLTNGESVSFFC